MDIYLIDSRIIILNRRINQIQTKRLCFLKCISLLFSFSFVSLFPRLLSGRNSRVINPFGEAISFHSPWPRLLSESGTRARKARVNEWTSEDEIVPERRASASESISGHKLISFPSASRPPVRRPAVMGLHRHNVPISTVRGTRSLFRDRCVDKMQNACATYWPSLTGLSMRHRDTTLAHIPTKCCTTISSAPRKSRKAILCHLQTDDLVSALRSHRRARTTTAIRQSAEEQEKGKETFKFADLSLTCSRSQHFCNCFEAHFHVEHSRDFAALAFRLEVGR